MTDVFAFGIGHSKENALGEPLDYFFPMPILRPHAEL